MLDTTRWRFFDLDAVIRFMHFKYTHLTFNAYAHRNKLLTGTSLGLCDMP
jgi:hypothetical protein